MRVRIRNTPAIDEIDGIRLDNMRPGDVREVSPTVGAWLIAEGYAVVEMRREFRAHEEDFLLGPQHQRDQVNDFPRRRRTDR